MIVRLKLADPNYPDLSEAHPYFVIGIEADEYRLLNDDGKPYLYPSELFDVIDSREPADWITEFGEDGERYSYPAPLNQPGFFEDFFDHEREQTSVFWHLMNKTLSQAAGLLGQAPTSMRLL
jgi:hypothetical protein